MTKTKNKFPILAGLALAVLGMGACSTGNAESVRAGDVEIHDPFEGTNRAVFAFNNKVDDIIIHPIAKGYNTVVPKPARTGVDNVLRNLKSPVTFANQALQGDVGGAGNVFVRTVINTLLGFGGLFDVAAAEGIEYEQEDFGQTLATWGVGHGPYLVVPIIGPSSLRDYVGYAVDSFADPLRWYLFNIDHEEIYYGKVGMEYLTLRASLVDVLEDLEKSSIDYYAATRSAYYQRRAALVNDQNPETAASSDIPDYDAE
ncbi:MAG: VacJ family lipoprotein [Alphaproteobacteria bacterium]|nr:VacJ family lipoprotein [Alphaproteobacteria bacterium]